MPAPNVDVETSYWTLRWGTVARTVDVSPEIQVDVTDDGQILGVERIGGVVDMGTLADVLRQVRL